MATFFSVALFFALRLLLISTTSAPLAGALPAPQASATASPAASSYWVSTIERNGTVAFGDPSYQIFRNVKTFGATGDGTTDDTAAINNAIASLGGSSGNSTRCGLGCDSSTTTPAIVYFPPGTYLVSAPIVQYYYTQFIGDAVTVPTLKAAAGFTGIAVIDSDPYESSGANWYTNQNNFFRQIRNFVIDLTAMPASQAGAGIHWQVAQATSLQNIVFQMSQGASGSKQSGVWMDNGSGGFMTDLVFNGGGTGAFLGNQQFTTRNLTFNNVQTAIYMNWNWVWTFKSLNINNCGVGLNMSAGGFNQSVGSILVQDSTFTSTPTGIITSFSSSQNVPATGGTLIIDNVDFTGSKNAIVDASGNSVLAGGSVVASWGQGTGYTTGSGVAANTTGSPSKKRSASTQIPIRGELTSVTKPTGLTTAQGAVFERSKPQYETLPASAFVSVKAQGAVGDGVTDDTAAIQKIFNSATPGQVVYFDHGAYLISSTVKVPANITITGEIWPVIMASGQAFSDQSNPAPVFQVGQPGDWGAVEMSDLIFETKGPQPGAIMVEWNVHETSQGASGMWDVHMRIGGSAGTGLQSDTCAKNPNVTAAANPACEGAFLLLHVTQQATIYLENNWFWVADHELDLPDHDQINIFNGRGVLIESQQGPVWMYGTSSEHSQLYNYQLNGASNVYMGVIQSETPYYQSNPTALTPFTPQANWTDPTFADCTSPSCQKSWGLRVVSSSNVMVFGAGLYSFFDNYSQTCLATESCQQNMVSVENCTSEVYLWGLSTKASTSMVTLNGQSVIDQADNQNTFCSTVAVFEAA